jgi:multidrug efflux pump subunit AcrA (membrane-fusion protein)
VLALVDGEVRTVLVREGDRVEAGQVLVQLDDARPRAELAAAEALLARLEADLALLRKGLRSEAVEVARERWITAERMARLAESEARRAGTAFRGGDVNAHVQELARGAAEVARQRAVEARHALDLAASPAQEEKIAAAEAAIAQARVDVDYRRQQLDYTQIRAPIAGRVVAPRLHYARGEVLERGESLARIENRERVLAEVSVAEADVPRLQLHGAGAVKPWAFGGRSFDAQVYSIAPAAERADGGPVVRVQLAVEDPQARLLSGMTGQAKIDGGWQPLVLVYTRALLRFLFVRAWSWIP